MLCKSIILVSGMSKVREVRVAAARWFELGASVACWFELVASKKSSRIESESMSSVEDYSQLRVSPSENEAQTYPGVKFRQHMAHKWYTRWGQSNIQTVLNSDLKS